METEIVRTLSRKNVYFARKCIKVANPGWNRLSFLISFILGNNQRKKVWNEKRRRRKRKTFAKNNLHFLLKEKFLQKNKLIFRISIKNYISYGKINFSSPRVQKMKNRIFRFLLLLFSFQTFFRWLFPKMKDIKKLNRFQPGLATFMHLRAK